MSIPENHSLGTDTEAHLQEELRSLFVVDTQHYLQRYSQIAQQLQADSWKGDIQELYRCVHTIKGGAVTVAAEAILQVATALEDVLADLRYLDLAPSLTDGHLNQALLEAGELLTGSLELQNIEATQPILKRIETLHQEIRDRYLSQWNEQRQLHQEFAEQGFDLVVLELEVALERLPYQGMVPVALVNTAQQTLAQLQQIGNELQFATGWDTLLHQAQTIFTYSESRVWRSQWLQLFQALKICAKQSGNPVPFEFADPEFASLELTTSEFGEVEFTDLELADLELSNSADGLVPTYPSISERTSETDRFIWSEPSDLQETLAEVDSFLDELQSLEIETSSLTNSDFKGETQTEIDRARENDISINTDTNLLITLDTELGSNSRALSITDEPKDLSDLSDISSFLDTFDSSSHGDGVTDALNTASISAPTVPASVDEFDRALPSDLNDSDDTKLLPDLSVDISADLSNIQAWLEQPTLLEQAASLEQPPSADTLADPAITTSSNSTETVSGSNFLSSAPGSIQFPSSKSSSLDSTLDKVQIPVPLEKLDRSSQHLVETLLSLRTTQGFYQTLQTQLMQLVALAQEGVQYVTHLRQIQDDYALLNDLRDDLQAATQGPTPERYRQGYTVINRLLETSLRLSEIGAETGKTAQHITENLRNVDTSVLKLQTTVEESRLVPFQNLTFRARAILRDLVTRYGKPARLVVQGEKTELDISTARNLEPALLHLIRNAYDHGLESVSDRASQGKPAQGTLTLSLQRQGNIFQLEFADDGGGMDAVAIQTRAESLNLPLTQTQTPAELLAVLCQPGFTSETQVSEISGRGVGMDVVAAQTVRLGGRLSLHTVPGRGTTFSLQFPVPRLLVPCMLLQAGEQTFAIPLDDIRTTTLLDTLNASRVKESRQPYSWMIENETGSIPALDLLEYWDPRFAGRVLPDTAVCIYVQPQTSPQGIWLLADELIEQSELIITPLPAPLVAPDGLMGVSLQTNGIVVPVLEARALAARLLAPSSDLAQLVPESVSLLNQGEIEHSSQTILIVDDAALMRRRLESSLNAYGYVTHTCADGREAWNWLQKHSSPRLVITDIEMPNMDGFTLVDRCRQTGITVPILVISSRLSEEWFDEAQRLGASDYLTKGFSTSELLEKVNVLLESQD